MSSVSGTTAGALALAVLAALLPILGLEPAALFNPVRGDLTGVVHIALEPTRVSVWLYK